eukprot:maker-scaffold866_size86999-snap-gene-0.18 protein:Tk02083 transcript:maker-scaffold866_size86999-snap-gene-0.18-mRNA-1 annotation:"EC1118_1D0_1398p"
MAKLVDLEEEEHGQDVHERGVELVIDPTGTAVVGGAEDSLHDESSAQGVEYAEMLRNALLAGLGQGHEQKAKGRVGNVAQDVAEVLDAHEAELALEVEIARVQIPSQEDVLLVGQEELDHGQAVEEAHEEHQPAVQSGSHIGLGGRVGFGQFGSQVLEGQALLGQVNLFSFGNGEDALGIGFIDNSIISLLLLDLLQEVDHSTLQGEPENGGQDQGHNEQGGEEHDGEINGQAHVLPTVEDLNLNELDSTLIQEGSPITALICGQKPGGKRCFAFSSFTSQRSAMDQVCLCAKPPPMMTEMAQEMVNPDTGFGLKCGMCKDPCSLKFKPDHAGMKMDLDPMEPMNMMMARVPKILERFSGLMKDGKLNEVNPFKILMEALEGKDMEASPEDMEAAQDGARITELIDKPGVCLKRGPKAIISIIPNLRIARGHICESIGGNQSSVKALCPQVQSVGLQMGAKADTLWYLPGFFKWATRAPWPPMECPMMPILVPSTWKRLFTRSGSSLVT